MKVNSRITMALISTAGVAALAAGCGSQAAGRSPGSSPAATHHRLTAAQRAEHAAAAAECRHAQPLL